MSFFDLDKQPQLVSLQMFSFSSDGVHAETSFSLAQHSSCTATHPPSLSFLPFCIFVPKLRSNSFLRAVLLEFNPPSLPFQPLFYCENLGSDLSFFFFFQSGLAHPPNPPCCCCCFADTPPPKAFSSIPASINNPAPFLRSLPIHLQPVWHDP